MTSRSSSRFMVIIGVAVLVLVLGLSNGSTSLFPWNDQSGDIFYRIRMPRVLLTFLVGGSLAISGLLCQLTLQNPLSDPYLLGISSGATVGAILSMGYLHLGSTVTGWFSFLGGLAGLFLSLLACGQKRWISPVSLLLAGTIVSFFLSAVALLTLSFTHAADLPGIIFWLAGDCSLADFTATRNVGLALIPAFALLLLFPRELEILETGDESARSLGVPTERIRWMALSAATLATAAAVATVGMIGFVGLMIPHAARGLLGHRARPAAIGAFLLGGTCLTFADLIARTAIPMGELPVGAVTALVGCPFFLLLLRRGRLHE